MYAPYLGPFGRCLSCKLIQIASMGHYETNICSATSALHKAVWSIGEMRQSIQRMPRVPGYRNRKLRRSRRCSTNLPTISLPILIVICYASRLHQTLVWALIPGAATPRHRRNDVLLRCCSPGCFIPANSFSKLHMQ